MAKHRATVGAYRWAALGILAATAVVVAGVVVVVRDGRDRAATTGAAGASCVRSLRVVTASSFAPVLQAVAPALDHGPDCVRLAVTVADGRAAAPRVSAVGADVWIPDDSAWAATADQLDLVEAPVAHAGSVLGTSPFFMVTDHATGVAIVRAGGGWLGLAGLVDAGKLRLAVRDPAGSGDGLVGAGAGAEAVWLDQNMDASALWLSNAQKRTRIVAAGPALPDRTGEVGIVPEYALLPTLSNSARALVALPGSDHTAMLRYTWFPLAAGIGDAGRATALERLRTELTGPRAAAYLRAARLRAPAAAQAAANALPTPAAAPFGPLAAHHVDHIFATWYPADRRTNLLVVVDVSGSMGAPAGGSSTSRIDLVRQGCRTLNALLPNDSRIGLWEFGSKLDGNRDYRTLLGTGALDARQRRKLTAAIGALAAQQTGTGLYDTVLAAYVSARNAYRPGVPNQVLVFTDGRNEADPNAPTAAQLSAALRRAADPKRPVLLSVVTFGSAADAKAVNDALAPVQGYVGRLTTAREVAAVFIHVTAGGLHR